MKNYQFNLKYFEEDDGKLGTFEYDIIPGFQVNRIIYIFDVPFGEERANHACMNASLVFIVLHGSVRLTIETEGVCTEYYLHDKVSAVYTPPASWIRAYDFSNDAVLIGLSDKRYKDCKYINDYDTYKEEIQRGASL